MRIEVGGRIMYKGSLGISSMNQLFKLNSELTVMTCFIISFLIEWFPSENNPLQLFCLLGGLNLKLATWQNWPLPLLGAFVCLSIMLEYKSAVEFPGFYVTKQGVMLYKICKEWNCVICASCVIITLVK